MSCRLNTFYDEMGQMDKLLHIQYSAAILLCLSLFFPLTVALVLTFLIGLGKEIWDRYYGSGFCFYDMAANLIGIAFVMPSILMVKNFF